ncbi:hypothetical protein KIPB_011435, partial [Kipferlia bialata]|eukprot:g11435.t1
MLLCTVTDQDCHGAQSVSNALVRLASHYEGVLQLVSTDSSLSRDVEADRDAGASAFGSRVQRVSGLSPRWRYLMSLSDRQLFCRTAMSLRMRPEFYQWFRSVDIWPSFLRHLLAAQDLVTAPDAFLAFALSLRAFEHSMVVSRIKSGDCAPRANEQADLMRLALIEGHSAIPMAFLFGLRAVDGSQQLADIAYGPSPLVSEALLHSHRASTAVLVAMLDRMAEARGVVPLELAGQNGEHMLVCPPLGCHCP